MTHHVGKFKFRVRYVECDPGGFLHHSSYVPYFEMGRVELLRELSGHSYREIEDAGYLFVVTRLSVNYKRPARFDDLLRLETRESRRTHVRIDHQYELFNDETGVLLCVAETTIACLGKDGRAQELPAFMSPSHSDHHKST